MSKKKSVGKYYPEKWEYINDTKHWTRLFDDMLDNKTFLRLSSHAKIIYIYLKKQFKGMNLGKNNVHISYDYMDKELHISRRKIKCYLDELEINGFIDITQSGGLYKVINKYSFSPNWITMNGNYINSSYKGTVKVEKSDFIKNKSKSKQSLGESQ